MFDLARFLVGPAKTGTHRRAKPDRPAECVKEERAAEKCIMGHFTACG